jgi:hypothetical protein
MNHEPSPMNKELIAANLIELSPELQAKLVEGLQNVPINKMLQQVQYLQQQALPTAEKKFGRNNENYRFYASLVDSLVWAMFILDKMESLQNQYGNNKLLLQFYQERTQFLEKQLQKYTTTEDLLLSGGIEEFAKSLAGRLNSMINQTQPQR